MVMNTQSLQRLGLRLKEHIGLDEMLGENFNPRLYSLTRTQREKIDALREVVSTYISMRDEVRGDVIDTPSKAVAIARKTLQMLDHEELWVAFLNRANMVLSFEMLFKGSIDSVVINPRDIIAKALSKDASGIIVYHNHPSGCPAPGTADIQQTNRLTKACKTMNIEMVDHIIIGAGSYFSFADERTSDFK